MTQNNVNLEKYSDELANNAKNASKKIRTLSAEKRAAVLARVAEILRAKKPEILAANKIDLEAAAGKLDDSKMDRLTLNDARIESMAKGAEEIAAFTDPLGRSAAFSNPVNSRTASRLAVSLCR